MSFSCKCPQENTIAFVAAFFYLRGKKFILKDIKICSVKLYQISYRLQETHRKNLRQSPLALASSDTRSRKSWLDRLKSAKELKPYSNYL